MQLGKTRVHILECFCRRTEAWLLVLAIAVSFLTQGCAYVTTAPPDSVAGYVEYMNRAARADDADWRTMKAEAERDYQESQSVSSQLRTGLLLTTPNRSGDDILQDMQKGRRLLQNAIERDDLRVGPDLRALVNIRLREVAARQALHRDLRTTREALQQTRAKLNDTEGKLNELLDIENSIENERQQNEGRQR